MNKAVFLDRDGTINKDHGYVHRPVNFDFLPWVIKALKIFKNIGFEIYVVTNQSGVARGYFKEEDVKCLHRWVDKELKRHDADIDGFYFCPHHPNGNLEIYTKKCDCRKPNPGLLKQAAKEHSI